MLLERSPFAALLLVATCLLPQPAWGWCHLEGFALGKGRRLYLLKTNTEADCARACEDVSPCTHWSFERGRSYCVLRAEDPAEGILIRRQDDAVSATTDCSLAISLATGGHSCFSDGWTVSPAPSDPSLSIEQRTSPLLHTCAAQSAEECQRLCQESDERCAAWEWNVLTEDCRLWDAHISLRRPNELPLGLSVYSSPSEQASIEIPDAQSREAALRRRLESMKTVVGPRVCPHALLAESRETNETASRASRCQIPTQRSYPWIVTKTLRVSSTGGQIGTLESKYDGRSDAGSSHATINLSALRTTYFQRAANTMTQVYQQAIQRKIITWSAVGMDSSTPPVKAVTDRVASPEACQSLCKSTSRCEMFTFYIDGRSGANCVLKPLIYTDEIFLHPVAFTGDKLDTISLALRGMKFGYEMASSTMFSPPKATDMGEKFTYEQMFSNISRIESLAKKACSLMGVKGYAVLDYISLTAHAVPASDAQERVMPNYNYIDCSKVS